jgi:hypothetical protein
LLTIQRSGGSAGSHRAAAAGRAALAALALSFAFVAAPALAIGDVAPAKIATLTPPLAPPAPVLTLLPPPAAEAGPADDLESDRMLFDDLAEPTGRRPSGVAGKLARWVMASDDNHRLPFMIVDKLGADVFAFDADGRFLGSAPVLVGLTPGDGSAPGVGLLKLSQIGPDQRTTPAGRFVARFGDTVGHGVLLWVDYRDAISLHPVMSVNPGERREQRIRSPDPAEHRISYGCINVPAAFYKGVVLPALGRGDAIVYVLPDTAPLEDVFPMFAASLGLDAAQAEPPSEPGLHLAATPTTSVDPSPARDGLPSPAP